MQIDFLKMHGAGNDFVVIDDLSAELDLTAEQAALLCDRHFGVGADGVILVRPSQFADCAAFMHYINADGSLAEMCGNGVRCFAKFLVDGGYVAPDSGDGRSGHLVAETRAGKRQIDFVTDAQGLLQEATVDIGLPRFAPEQIPTTLAATRVLSAAGDADADGADDAGAASNTAGESSLSGEQPTDQSAVIEQNLATPFGNYQATCVNMGNPHLVIFSKDFAACPEAFNLAEAGRWLEQNTGLFPEKVNVEFAALTGENQIIMRVFERGVGETLACGTGACAVAVAAALTGRAGRQVSIALPGGILQINWRASDGHVLMTGPAATVYEGTIQL